MYGCKSVKNPSFGENPPTDKAALDRQTDRVNKASLMFNSKKPETNVQPIGVEQKARITNKKWRQDVAGLHWASV
jgi:hypothetical protein